MRRYYDSRALPFLSDLLFDQLLNFDWESSRKEIEEERRKAERNLSHLEKFCKKRGERCNYLLTDEDLNKDLKVCTPEFKLEEGKYTYETRVGSDVKPSNVKVDVIDGSLHLSYSCTTETSAWAASSVETLPRDLDVNSMKAVLKNGVLTITANQIVRKEEEKKKEPEEEVEYEIEIGK